MSRSLCISDDLSLPPDAVTQTFGILAVRGAGKSNAAAAMAEEMQKAGLPFVVIDPVGSWYGLRSSGDGRGPGLPIPIFGGRHGDVPLERTGGVLIADIVVDERLTCVIDCSDFSEGDKTRFLIDFAERLYKRNTYPLHLFLEEADDFIPQRPFREQARLLRAWENIVRRGRARGLGITMITQRSAAINKSVLTQIETLLVLRTTSPQDRAAIKAWVDYQGGSRDMLETLPKLQAGEAWVWSPSWLQTFKRIHVRRRWTFDSGATPKSSRGARAIATLADVDIDAITAQMAETIERAKQDDPRELRKTLAACQKMNRELLESNEQIRDELGRARSEQKVERVEVAAIRERDVDRLEAVLDKVSAVAGKMQTIATTVRQSVEGAREAARAKDVAARAPAPPMTRPTPKLLDAPAVTIRSQAVNGPGEKMSGAERKVLTALAQYPDGLSKRRLAVLTGYAVNGGGFGNAISACRTKGRLLGSGDKMVITDAGRSALGSYMPLPTGAELQAYWLAQLGKAEREILIVLCREHPAALTKDEIAQRTESKYAPDGGGFGNALSRLRTLELIHGRREMQASDDLFG